MRINYLFFPTLLISFALFGLGRYLFRLELPKFGRIALVLLASLVAIPGLLFVMYYFHLFDNAKWFYDFRAAPLTELFAAGMGLGTGILQEWTAPDSAGHKAILPFVLSILIFVPYMKSALSPVDLSRLHDDCPSDVCLQSTESSCGPASAANILKSLGMPASERQIARDSFTSTTGTENWYLARSLSQRGLDVHVVVQQTETWPLPSPSIAGVILRGGAGHFIAILDSDNAHVTMVDPLIGRISFSRAELSKHYHFTDFFLVIKAKAKV